MKWRSAIAILPLLSSAIALRLSRAQIFDLLTLVKLKAIHPGE
ncbi:hypothetical protein [Phormidium sp. CCY1219]|nr:hypothetical protein [Phormidium sp. CCY1219]